MHVWHPCWQFRKHCAVNAAAMNSPLRLPAFHPAARAASADWPLFAAALALGIAMRLFWLDKSQGLFDFAGYGEATHVALSIARSGVVGDAYFAGQGPTAHLTPGQPLLAVMLMRIGGIDTAAGNLLLLGLALSQALLGYWLMARLFERLGAHRAGRRGAMLFLLLLPLFAPQETIDFRWWEGAFAVCLGAANLLLVAAAAQGEPVTPRRMLRAGFAAALAFFVSPPVGFGVAAAWGVVALRRLRPRQALAFAAIGLFAFAIVLAPWTIRNAMVMGKPIPLRSNAALELALANNDAMVAPADPARAFATQLTSIHPYHSPDARSRMATLGGELAYMHALDRQVRGWISAHPAEFARLSARHLRQFFFPEPWQMTFAGWPKVAAARALTFTVVALAGLIALAGLARRALGYAALAAYVGGVALPYAFVQPIPRYSYLVYALLVFAAAEGVAHWRTAQTRHTGA
jgi:hypothetical protein